MKKFIVSILILSSVFLNGCVEKSVQGNKNVNIKDYIVYNVGELPKDLSMLTDYNIRQQDFLVNLFEGLVKTDEKGNIIPGLSDSWTLSKDETCYTFNIREDAKWSDGSDITAEDFVTFFSQILNTSFDGEYIFGGTRATTKPVDAITDSKVGSVTRDPSTTGGDASVSGTFYGSGKVTFKIEAAAVDTSTPPKVTKVNVLKSTDGGTTYKLVSAPTAKSDGTFDIGNGLTFTIPPEDRKSVV